MGVYNNNKDGTRSTIANTIQVVDAPMEQFVSRGEFSAVVPSDTSADNKLVNNDKFDTNLNDIWKVQGEFGAKNLLKKPYDSPMPFVSGGITFSDNKAGGIVINGTSTSYVALNMIKELEALPHGNYILSVQEDLPRGVVLQFGYVTTSGTTTFVQKGYNALTTHSKMVTVDDKFDGNLVCIRIGINNNTTLDNLVVHPMLRYASDIDDTWQPYVPTNRELAKRVDDIANNVTNDMNDIANNILKTQSILGAKNLLVYPYAFMPEHYIAGNVDFQLDMENQGCFILNRTQETTTTYTHRELYASNITPQFILPKGEYIVSDGIDDNDTSQTGQANCAMMFRFADLVNDRFVQERNTSSGVRSKTFTVTEEQEQAQRDGILKLNVRVYCNPSKGAIENVRVKPMIRYASDTDNTWQPYAPTNYQLNQKVDMIAGVYLPNASTPTSKKVVASVGQTSVTFDASSFMTQYNVTASDLDLDISAKTSSGDIVSYKNVNITGGIVTVTFDALAEQTTFICKCSVIQ